MRLKVNSQCNVCTLEHSQAFRSYQRDPAPQITVPHLRLRLSIDEAKTLAANLTEAITMAEKIQSEKPQ